MPTRRAILLRRTRADQYRYPYVLWADVPAGNQIAYRNPAATTAYENATPAELQAIRDGAVAEEVGEAVVDFGGVTGVQALVDARWSAFQARVTAETLWDDYGRYADSAGAWQASPGVPMYAARELPDPNPPTYVAFTPVSGFAANKFHFVLHNNGGALGQALAVKVRLVVWQPGTTTVTGASGGLFTLRRRSAPTTPPSGSGSFAPVALDSAAPLPPAVACYSPPGVAPAGGTAGVVNEFTPQADELKLSTLDGPTMASLGEFGGQVVYRQYLNSRPLVIRSGETLEIQQGATAGLGNGRALVLFTVG